MNNMNNMNMFQYLQGNQGGCCYGCAMLFNAGWVEANSYQMNMMNQMNHMMDQMNQMNKIYMMNPMFNQMNQMKMMSQMNQMNQNKKNSQNLNKDSNENNNNILNQEINVFFNNISENIPLNIIQCTLSDKVSDIIQEYRNKTLDKETTNIFHHNGKALDLNMTAAEAGLHNLAIIHVINTKNVDGS